MLKNVKMPITAGGGTSSSSIKSALKRGFTIMELVIVIAVIAVLAAVLIPTFANITNRANESADEQTVTNMNKILSAEDALDNVPTNTGEVRDILLSGGIQTYTPVSAGWYYGWLPDENVIVIYEVTDGKSVIAYPETYANKDYEVWNLENNVVATADDLVQAISNAEEGSTVQIAEDLTLGEGDSRQGLYFKKGISFDLNGNTLSMGANSSFMFEVMATDETVNTREITISNGVIADTANSNSRDSYNNPLMYLYYDYESEKVPLNIVMENVTVKANSGNVALAATNGGAALTLRDVNIQGMCVFTDVASVTIESGTFTGNEGDDYILYSNVLLTINDGKFETKENQYALISSNTTAPGLVINGGTFTGGRIDDEDSDDERELICLAAKSNPTSNGARESNARLTITGGVFNGSNYTGSINGAKFAYISGTGTEPYLNEEGFGTLSPIVGIERFIIG